MKAVFKPYSKIFVPTNLTSGVEWSIKDGKEDLDSSMGYLKLKSFLGLKKKMKKVIEGKKHGTPEFSWPKW